MLPGKFSLKCRSLLQFCCSTSRVMLKLLISDLYEMVQFNIEQFVFLIKYLRVCPVNFPKREKIILEAYNAYKSKSQHYVSVEVDPDDEVIPECRIEDYPIAKKNKIIKFLIDKFSRTPIDITVEPSTVYICPEYDKCPRCLGDMKIWQSYRGGAQAIAYTSTGPKLALVFHKNCSTCSTTVFNGYYETVYYNGTDKETTYRTYFEEDTPFLSATNESFFERTVLQDLNEDLFGSDVRLGYFS